MVHLPGCTASGRQTGPAKFPKFAFRVGERQLAGTVIKGDLHWQAAKDLSRRMGGFIERNLLALLIGHA